MKGYLRLICAILLVAMLMSGASALVFADDGVDDTETDPNVITVGQGGKYANIAKAIAGETTDGLDGKTLLLVSDVGVSSTKFESSASKRPTIVVDGNGYEVSLSTGFVCVGVNITFKNMNATQTAPNHPFIYARKGAYVTVESCTTDESFQYAFSLNSAGDCHLTVSSGTYYSYSKVFKDDFDNIGKAQSTITVNGGTFALTDKGGSVVATSGYTDFTINGGLFVGPVNNPIILDTMKFTSGKSEVTMNINGGTFLYPSSVTAPIAYNSDGGSTPMKLTVGGDAKFFGVIESDAAGTPLAQKTVSLMDMSASALTLIGKAHLASSAVINVANELVPTLDNSFFDGALVALSADCSASVDFSKASLVFDKNGYKADGVKSTGGVARIRSGLDGADIYLQMTGDDAPVGNAKSAARFVVGINDENYKAAGLLYTFDSAKANATSLVYNKLGTLENGVEKCKAKNYYKSILADGESVDARELDALHLLTLDIGEYGEDSITKTVYLRAYAVSADGKISYSAIKYIKLEDYFYGSGAFVGTYNVDDGHTLDLYQKVSKDSFELKCDSLLTDGYELKFENAVNGNVFRTYHRASDNMMTHIYWIEHSKEMKLIKAETDKLPIVSTGGDDSKCSALLHAPAGEDELCYIVRLNDGRFIVVDGGNDTAENGKEIYDFLKANAPDPNNIVIAAWIITHGHGDHYGGFKAFARKYSTDTAIKLECMMYNQANSCDETAKGRTSDDTLRYMETYYPDVPVYKPLSGQKYTFSKTTVEILWTIPDFMPNSIVLEPDGKGDGNTQTMVFTIDIVNDSDKDDKLFVMGDTVVTACDEIADRYGEYIKCDIVQVSHHGLCVADYCTPYRRRNSTKEIYTLIDADKALWPGKDSEVERRMTGEVNIHLVSIVGMENIYFAGKGAYTFEFK